ncbi:hypothetical protein SSX86_021551 [Deinandra increscens subsp. villosa]|uniref:TNase-like domain-containing protein n=1 Tax=Deinandra increscens subsp. villosa TaxID=3103831 RepID=A0AAP0GSN8_9ASTR
MGSKIQKRIRLKAFVDDVDTYKATKKIPTINDKFLSSHTWSEVDTVTLFFEALVKKFDDERPDSFEQANKLCTGVLYGLHREHQSDVQAFLEVYGFEVPKLEVLLAKPLIVKPLFSLTANGDELSIMDGDGFTVFEFVTPSKHTPRWVLKHLQQLGKGERNDLLKFSGRNEEEPNDYACVGQCLLKQRFPIRLRGVDAPEADQPYGIESRDALRKMLKGKRVQIVAYELCPHKRYLADVYVENKCVQELLLQEAAVWYLEKGSRQEQSWMKLHYSNKRNRKGLWGPPGASSGYQPTFPWRWMQKQDIWKKAPTGLRVPEEATPFTRK